MVPGGNGELGPRLQEEQGPAHLPTHLLLPVVGTPQWADAASPIQGPAPGTPAAPQPPRCPLTLVPLSLGAPSLAQAPPHPLCSSHSLIRQGRD